MGTGLAALAERYGLVVARNGGVAASMEDQVCGCD
jgi:poly(3-hydroxybutyrate) depolymerase